MLQAFSSDSFNDNGLLLLKPKSTLSRHFYYFLIPITTNSRVLMAVELTVVKQEVINTIHKEGYHNKSCLFITVLHPGRKWVEGKRETRSRKTCRKTENSRILGGNPKAVEIKSRHFQVNPEHEIQLSLPLSWAMLEPEKPEML